MIERFNIIGIYFDTDLNSITWHDEFYRNKKVKKNPDESDFYDEKGKVLIINNEYNREKKWVAIYTWKSVQIFLI